MRPANIGEERPSRGSDREEGAIRTRQERSAQGRNDSNKEGATYTRKERLTRGRRDTSRGRNDRNHQEGTTHNRKEGMIHNRKEGVAHDQSRESDPVRSRKSGSASYRRSERECQTLWNASKTEKHKLELELRGSSRHGSTGNGNVRVHFASLRGGKICSSDGEVFDVCCMMNVCVGMVRAAMVVVCCRLLSLRTYIAGSLSCIILQRAGRGIRHENHLGFLRFKHVLLASHRSLGHGRVRKTV